MAEGEGHSIAAAGRGGFAAASADAGESVALDASFRYCHAVTRRRARNFYYGLKLTPEPRRSAGYAIYAFMRACDDLVDQPSGASPSSLPSAAGSAGGLSSSAIRSNTNPQAEPGGWCWSEW